MPTVSNLHLFCECIVRKHETPGRATEEQKAEEFRRVFLKNFQLNLNTLCAVASTCGIELDGLDGDKMPENLRGYHEIYGNRRYIYFRKDDSLSGTMNTILHEIREMMEKYFVEMCPTYEPLRTSARHIAANRFASAVLLPQKGFTSDVYETGLDIFELAKLYSKSCSQVLLRMGEVLQGKLFLYSALYGHNPETDDWMLNYWTMSHNYEDPDANICGANEFFPRKGKAVMQGSLVDMAIRGKKSYLAERVTLIDETDDEGLVALASPMIIAGVPIKVALVVLTGSDRNLLLPQIERTNPTIIKGFHRHL